MIVRLVAGVTLAMAVALPSAAPTMPNMTLVDAATLRFNDELFRLAGIDAPAIDCRCVHECLLAGAARERTRRLIDGGEALLFYDRDGLSRPVNVRVRIAAADLGERLVVEGYAQRSDGTVPQPWCSL